MNIVILAAGFGRRLQPLTAILPKTLLPVRDKAILEYICDAAREHDLTTITIVSGHGHTALKKFSDRYNATFPGMNLTLRHNAQFDTAGNVMSLHCVADLFNNDDICIINSDTIFHPDLLRFLKETPDEHAMIVDDHKILGHEEMKVTVNKNDHVEIIAKTLSPDTAVGEYVGLLKLSSSAAGVLRQSLDDQLRDDPGGYYEDALQRLIRDHHVNIKKISTQGLPVMEIDTHEDLRDAQELAF